MPEMHVVTCCALAMLGGLVCGLACGWAMASRVGKRELQAYKDGQRDEHERRADLGGPCWVRSQLPPQSDE